MIAPISQFKQNIDRVRNVHIIYNILNIKTTEVVDVSDVLRAELVLVVSAFDHYVHEVVRQGMLEVFQGKRVETPSFRKFTVSLECLREAISNPSTFDWLENEIILRNSWKSFQQAEKVAEAIRLISDINLWVEIANKLGKNPKDLKSTLNLIVDRRNKIAHEADMDPSYPGIRWPIDEVMIENAIGFIEEIVEMIDQII